LLQILCDTIVKLIALIYRLETLKKIVKSSRQEFEAVCGVLEVADTMSGD